MANGSNKRGRPRRIWVKLHCDGVLRGSINYQLSLEEQAVWMKLLALTAVCGGQDGWIQDNDQRPLPHFFIASELHCPLETFESSLAKCIEEGRCRENSQGIEIVNWKYYQSEYDRQKPYRVAQKGGKKIAKVCPVCGYKASTSETCCPECDNGTELVKDYTGGKYGHMVKH